MRERWTTSITTRPVELASRPKVRAVALTLFYLAVLVGLAALYGRGDVSTPSFVYQDF
jgi:hypothetical protein